VPAAVYLEMAYAAASLGQEKQVTGLHNVIWPRPMLVQGNLDVTVRLEPVGDAYRYTISAPQSDAQGGQPATCCQGHIIIAEQEQPVTGRLELDAIQARCGSVHDTEACHHLMQSTHGPSLLSIVRLHHNDHEALAELVLPAVLGADRHGYLLHPSMLN